jgi:hypothetical protein
VRCVVNKSKSVVMRSKANKVITSCKLASSLLYSFVSIALA